MKACAELVRRVVNGEPLDDVDPDGSNSMAMGAKKAMMTSWLQILPAKDKGKASASAKENSDVLIVVGSVTYLYFTLIDSPRTSEPTPLARNELSKV